MSQRIIKFRAWNEENAHMYDWKSVQLIYGMPMFSQCEIYKIKFMQFIGLEDRNGVEIYEGDIAEITYNFGEAGYTEIGVMEFNQKYAQFGFLSKDSLLEKDYEKMTVKVIGNVYENPDLLTKGKENELL